MDNKEYQKQYRLINKQRISTKQAEWYRNNRERLLEKDRIYKQKHKDRINQLRKFYPSAKVNPIKKSARDKIRYRIKKGLIKALPCVECGESKTHAHHEDYSKPLEVIWLCSKHHGLRHRKTITN